MRRFITDASHELRTPLTTIRGFAELYRQGAAKRRRNADEPHRERVAPDGPARRGPAAAGPARPATPAGTAPGRPAGARQRRRARCPVDRAASRTITMEVFDGPGTPEVLGDEARLRQVLGNLVANALQHTPETAGITVRVGTDDGRRGPRGVRRGTRDEPSTTRIGSSSASTAPTPRAPAPAAAPAWACRSSTRWSTRTAARSASPPRRERAADSRSTCRASPTSAGSAVS